MFIYLFFFLHAFPNMNPPPKAQTILFVRVNLVILLRDVNGSLGIS